MPAGAGAWSLVRTARDALHSAAENVSGHHHAAATPDTLEPYVGADSGNSPLRAAARVRLAHRHEIARLDFSLVRSWFQRHVIHPAT
jgi:hypothetical protein